MGRLILIWLVLAVAIVGQSLGARAAAVTAPTPRAVTIVVRRGETLWSIASRLTGESGDVRATVDRLASENGLGSGPLVAGRVLTLARPAPVALASARR